MIIAAIMYQSPLVLVFQKMYVRKKKYQKGCYIIAAHILCWFSRKCMSGKKISERVLRNCSTYFVWLCTIIHINFSRCAIPSKHFFNPQRSGHNYHFILFVHIPDCLPNLYNLYFSITFELNKNNSYHTQTFALWLLGWKKESSLIIFYSSVWSMEYFYF